MPLVLHFALASAVGSCCGFSPTVHGFVCAAMFMHALTEVCVVFFHPSAQFSKLCFSFFFSEMVPRVYELCTFLTEVLC